MFFNTYLKCNKYIVLLQATDELNTRLAQNDINIISNGLSYIDDDDAGSIITTLQVSCIK